MSVDKSPSRTLGLRSAPELGQRKVRERLFAFVEREDNAA